MGAYEIFIEPLENGFMRNAIACITLVGVSSAILGTYILLRRSVFITSALTHTILPGIVAATLLGVSIYAGAFAAAVTTAVAVGIISRRGKIHEDTAIGIVLSFMFALGILLMTRAQSFRDFTGLLFGGILGVTETDLIFAGTTLLVVLAAFFIFRRRIALVTFDEEYARSIGLNTRLLGIGFLALVALAAVSSVRIVGALLTTALLVIPAASAAVFMRAVGATMLLASAISVLSGILGLYISYHCERVPAGAAIVITTCAVFFLLRVTKFLRSRH